VVVLTPSGSAFAAVADDVAEERDEAVVSSAADAIADRGTVVYVATPNEIREDVLLSLQRASLRGEVDGFSVVTGYEPADARALYHRDDAGDSHASDTGNSHASDADDSHAMLLRSTPDGVTSRDARVIGGDRLTVDEVADATANRLQSLSIQTGGTSLHLNLRDGFVCGAPSSRDVGDFDEPQPYCVRDGEVECPLTGSLIEAETVDADHVFVSSCASMIPNDSSGLPVHVGMALLDGASTLVGSYRVAPSRPEEALLHHALVRAGYPLAKRCDVLNRAAHAWRVTGYPYFAFGRPESVAVTEPPAAYDVSTTAASGGVHVECSDVDAHVVAFSLDPDVLDGDDVYVRAEEAASRDVPLFYAAFETDGQLRVLVFSDGKIRTDSLSLAVTGTPVRADDRAVLLDSVAAADHHRSFDIFDDKQRNHATDVQSRLGGLADEIAAERFDADAWTQTHDAIEDASEQLDALADEIASKATDTTFLMDLYASSAVDDDTYVSDVACADCGQMVFVKQVTDATRRFARGVGMCPRCAIVFDVPIEPGTREPERPVLSVDEASGTTRDVTVSFRNHRDRPVHAHVAVDLPRADREFDATLVEPSRRRIEVPPGSEDTAEFVLDTEPLTPGEYAVRGVVVANMDLYSCRQEIRVGDVAGHVPFHRT
jgi:DNA-directed RNA polymerase subunit RPC12/RpoP